MGLEAGTYINDLTPTNPLSTDKRKQGDDHLRLIKSILKLTFPNADKAFYFNSYEAITSNETVAAADMNKVYGASTTGGAFTVTLPTSLGAIDDGFHIAVVKLETNTNRVTVTPNSGTINGIASLSVTNAGDRIDAYWTGTAWIGVVTLAGVDRVSITTNTTVDATHFDKLLDVVPASANLTLTLPAVSLYLGRTLTVKLNSATYTCTLTPNGAETIDGASSWLLEARYDSVTLLAVTGGWFVLSAQGSASTIPIGSGMDYWGATAPSGWLLAFGQAVSRTTYAKLFTALGTTHGAGDGSTTFNLPDKRGRVSVGKDDMGGSSANRLTNQTGGLNGDTLGATGGSETHVLTKAQLAAHDHLLIANVTTTATLNPTNHVAKNANYGGDNEYILSGTTTAPTLGLSGEAGSGTAHNNVQPTIVANYIIKY
jgi:microcystin-dependent protein